MNRFPYAVAIVVLLASCASEDGKAKDVAEPTPLGMEPTAVEPKVVDSVPPIPPAATMPTPAIASVQMAQDCPTPTQAPAADSAIAPSAKPDSGSHAGASRMRRGKGLMAQPCTQSSMQVSLSGAATAGSSVVIKELRLRTVDGKAVATLAARVPTLWKSDGYAPWDGTLTSDAQHKASYSISVPDWALVEKAIGKSSYNTMFVLDVDIDVGGTVSTVSSPQFERTQPLMIRT